MAVFSREATADYWHDQGSRGQRNGKRDPEILAAKADREASNWRALEKVDLGHCLGTIYEAVVDSVSEQFRALGN